MIDGTTALSRALRDCVNAQLTTPMFAEVYGTVLQRMQSGYYQRAVVDAIGQSHIDGDLTIYDAYAFALTWCKLQSGRIALTRIGVDVEPGADASSERNRMALTDLPSPFTAHFEGGKGDSDGHLAWSSPVAGDTFTDDGAGASCRASIWLPPRRVPLEVGTTSFITTYAHLYGERGLARWAYGSRNIYLFTVVGGSFESIV